MKIFISVSFAMVKYPELVKLKKKKKLNKKLFSQVAVLQTKLKDKENELQNILLEFSESQKCCRQLQETTSNMKFPISKHFFLIIYWLYTILIIFPS